MRAYCRALTVLLFGLLTQPTLGSPTTTTAFANFENPTVHPIDLHTTLGLLAVANLPAGRLELYDATGPVPVLLPGGSIPVGLDPCSVRFRPGTTEAWVVNKISDTISVVDTDLRRVVATLKTGDDPSDIVFAGQPLRAFVSCSLPNEVHIFQPDTRIKSGVVKIAGNRPRSMTVSPDGSRIHIALFESGNRTTIIGGGHVMGPLSVSFPPDGTANAAGPYSGQTPPPNSGSGYSPAPHPSLPPAPNVGIVVRQQPDGRWLDDNNGDWTSMVSGAQANLTGRVSGWTLIDRDIATLQANSLEITYTGDLMNVVMDLATAPDGRIFAVGTDARNHIRFEPNLKGRFLDVLGARVNSDLSTTALTNLNGANYGSSETLPLTQRQRAVGDPRATIFSPDGSTIYVAGMGSNNLTRYDSNTLDRIGTGDPLLLGEGPSGLIYDEALNRIFVFNRFDATLSVVDAVNWVETSRTPVYDPTPQAIRFGRQFLYDTVEYSGSGHVSCGSCHIDARMDKLAWDLGDPLDHMSTVSAATHNLGGNMLILRDFTEDSHPMKGPMMTQTFQDIIGMEPLHWRGDRLAFEDFNGTFVKLQAADSVLSAPLMAGFRAFVDTIIIPPNPNREVTNAFRSSLPLPAERSTGRFSPVGSPMPAGRPANGLSLYISGTRRMDGNLISCAACHSLPSGAGTDKTWNGSQFVDIPRGPRGENHVAVVGVDGSLNTTLKVPHLRNMPERNGMTQTTATTVGFGFVHDGSVDSLVRFFSDSRFQFQSDQEISDMVALMLSFSGSDMADGGPFNANNPPGPKNDDSPAGTGVQFTYTGGLLPDLMTTMTQLAVSGTSRLDLIAKANLDGLQRGWWYDRVTGKWLSDRNGEETNLTQIQTLATINNPVAFTLVLRGTGKRLGIDADLDGYFDRTEKDSGSNWEVPGSIPPRATLDFAQGNDAIASTTTLSVHPKTMVTNLEPLSEVAGSIWQVQTTRTGWAQATLRLQWTPDDVAGFTIPQINGLKVFTAPAPSGPWTPLPTSLDIPNRTASVEVTHFSWFAIGQASVPVSLTDFGLE